MRHWVRWTDYGESYEDGSSCHTTTTAPQRLQRGTRKLPRQFLEDCGDIGHIARHCPAPTPGSQAPQPPTTNPFPLTTPQIQLGRLGRTHGLYLNCELNGTPCRALVNTGSTITGERARMQEDRFLQVTAANHIVDNKFRLADMQDPCINDLDLLAKWEAMVDVPRTTL